MRIVSIALAALIMVGASAAVARGAVHFTSSYSAVMATHSLASDTSLSDPDWMRGKIADAGNRFEDITTRSAAPLETAAYMLYDAQNLYVAFDVQQSNVRIIANQTTNNIGFGLDDFVGIGIDTSGNGSTVYYFETTPRGTRYQQASESSRYNPVWRTAARVGNASWTAVLTIPLRAFHHGSAPTQTWRFNFVRGVAATGEHYTWAFDGTMTDGTVPQWPAFSDSQFWPRLSGIHLSNGGDVRFGDRARTDVYALGSAGTDRKLFQQANGSFQPEPARAVGIDFNYALTDSVHFVATVNPDFSNVEVDQQTIAPQEFRRPLIEYRPFFAEGAAFLNPVSPSAGAAQPNNQLFYSPDIGPFDRGAKLEGSFGNQSFGLLSFRGYDETSGNVFDDIAYGYTHALPDQSFSYWSDGVLAHHSIAGSDAAAEAGAQYHNLHTGVVGGVDQAFEGGSYVLDPGHARALSMWGQLIKPNYGAFIDYQDVTPNYNPIDGFTSISDTRGFVYGVNVAGSSRTLKNYSLFVGTDQFMDASGAVHQADALATIKATFKDQISLSIGPHNGELRSYSTSAPGPSGCDDPSLIRTAYTGFPNYYCGRTDRFEQLNVRVGYRDGSQSPTDVTFAEGPFGGTFLHQYLFSTSRPLGTRFSVAAQYGGTSGVTASSGALNSQWLRLVSFGYNVDSDSSIAFELRSINGIVNGLTTTPGLNVAASYHRRYVSGNELYLTFGTPAATQTLDRFIVKYVFHAGPQS